MQYFRPAADRGTANFGWLDSRHSFSFGQYHDPRHMGFGPLRVINDDRVAPGGGFDLHGHRDMEIISVVLEGGLAHKDSMGNGSTIRPGDVQLMSAGTGVQHSEFNASDSQAVHFLQIWIQPASHGLPPAYQQIHVSDPDKTGKLHLVASADGANGSLKINRDMNLYASRLNAGQSLNLTVEEGRGIWVQLIEGELRVNDQLLQTADGLGLVDTASIAIEGSSNSEFLVFDLDHA